MTADNVQSAIDELSVIVKGIPKTYAELGVLKTAGELIENAFYRITDFQTTHIIPLTATVNTGSIEELVIKAISVNSFSPEAFSPSNPNDIIMYDFDDNEMLAAGDGRWDTGVAE